MTLPTAMATGIEIRTQSRAVRRMVKEDLSNFANPADLTSPHGDSSGARASRQFSRQNMSTHRRAGKLRAMMPPPRKRRFERPKIYLQSSSHASVVVSRHRSEHYRPSHPFRYALQFAFDISDN